MPTRRLPRTDAERDTALRAAKDRKDAIPAPLIIPFTAGTITRLDAFQPAYRTKYEAVLNAKNAQTTLTDLVEEARHQGIYHVLDFIEALNRAIRRKLFLPTVRNLYNIAVDDDKAPVINSEAELTTWGVNINAGETARIAAGGAPITFPSLANVNAAVGNFNTLNAQQSNAKDAYDVAQEAVEADNIEADKLILKLWNEIETAFDTGNKPSTRRKAREWGVVYTITQGETLNPDEFSITGTITNSTTGLPVEGAAIIVESPEVIVLTETNGKYYVPKLSAGTYQMTVHKDGYANQLIEGIVITDGTINTIDAQLAALTSVVIEGDALIGSINDINTGTFTTTPSTTMQIVVGLNELQWSAAPSPGPVMGPTVWHVSPGTQNKTNDAFRALTGASEVNTFYKVQCVGPMAGHYKITFNNVIAL